MKFTFEVGQQEKHHVEFSWEKFFGVAKIHVDGTLVLKSKPLAYQDLAQLAGLRLSTSSAKYLAGIMNGTALPELVAGWSIEIGQEEKHCVHIEKERPKILAGFRAHTYRVFIDGQFVEEHVG